MRLRFHVWLLLVALCLVSDIAYLAFDSSAVWASRIPLGARHFVQTDRHLGPPVATIDTGISSVQVLSLESSSTAIGTQLTITNTSSQKIVEVHAYLDELRVGKPFWGIEHDPIPPGGTATLRYNYDPTPHTIKIVALVFEDGTGEGNQRVLDDAFRFSNGYRQQLQRHMSVLSDFVKGGELSGGSITRGALAKLRKQMEAADSSLGVTEDPFESQGRRAATAWIMVPVRHLESLTSAQATGRSHSDATTRIQESLAYVIDKCVALDSRLAKRTASRSLR